MGRPVGVPPRELSPIEEELEAAELRGEFLKILPGRNLENADDTLLTDVSDGDETRLGVEVPAPARYDLDRAQAPKPRLMLVDDSLLPISDGSEMALTVVVGGSWFSG